MVNSLFFKRNKSIFSVKTAQSSWTKRLIASVTPGFGKRILTESSERIDEAGFRLFEIAKKLAENAWEVDQTKARG